jgi:hypothetical protein
MIRPKALLEDRQSPAVQRLRLGVPVGLGQQSGELAEAQPGRASRGRLLKLGDPAWISLPESAWLGHGKPAVIARQKRLRLPASLRLGSGIEKTFP